MKREKYFLEVSASQQCFHIDEAKELLFKNLRAFVNRGDPGEYVPVMMGTYEECQAVAEKLLPVMNGFKYREELKQSRVH